MNLLTELKKYRQDLPSIGIFLGAEFLILLLNFSWLHLLYLLLINCLFCLYFLRKINTFMLPVIAVVGLGLSVFVSGVLKHEVIINSPAYVEVINQLRGGSDTFGKLFFNKILYGYFYIKNIATYLDVYFWIERVGFITVLYFFAASILLVKKLKQHTLIMLIFLLPVGLLVDPKSALNYLFFIPIVCYLIVQMIRQFSKQTQYILAAIFIIGIIIQYFWSVEVIL